MTNAEAIIVELRAALAVAMGENEGRIALERKLQDERDQALAKVEGLNLAADQYSASRDQWMLKAKAAEADAAALRIALKWYGDLVYSHRMGLPSDVQFVAEAALEATNAGAAFLVELEAARKVVTCWRDRQPPYFDDCDPGQNDPYYAWYAEMSRLTAIYYESLKAGSK